ncbi:MAG: sigma 54-dependent Fis family transcriptional regulator [Deltaproteobacteria bacterium]|nr:sigma 54-dependent Fis family transcriptional regulator [Deltaproteobacteria bacterium]
MTADPVQIQKLGRPVGRHVAVHRARSRLAVIRGPSSGQEVVFEGAICTVGREAGTDVTIADPDVAARHLDIALGERGFLLSDLASPSGTHVGGIRIDRVYLRPGAVVELGSSAFRFDLTGDAVVVPLYDGERLGDLVGRSIPMRESMAQIVRLAGSTGPVLVTGEPGVECQRGACAVHAASNRRDGPLEKVVCSPADHDIDRRIFGFEPAGGGPVPGALDRTARGTLVLVDVERLPLDLQPALLRLLDSGVYRRVGGTREIRSASRIVATSGVSLAARVRCGQVRADLAQRFLSARVVLPPLRHRMEDLRMLVGGILADEVPQAAPIAQSVLRVLSRYDWPGNFDELHDVVTGALRAPSARKSGSRESESTKNLRVPAPSGVKLTEAKRRWAEAAEEAYLAGLVISTGHDLAECARLAGVAPRTLKRLLAKHKLG